MASRLERRNADPFWSPVVDLQYVEVGKVRALYLIRRLAYPVPEVVTGSLMIPLPSWTYSFEADLSAGMTGVRYAVLSVLRAREQRAANQQHTLPEGPELTLEYMDDPIHDDKFPSHPLSILRAAFRWLTDPDGAGLKVTIPPSVNVSREVTLPHLGCAIHLPPRYVFSPGISSRMGHSGAVYTRMALPAGSLLLIVEKLGDARIRGWNRHRGLARYANQFIHRWPKKAVRGMKSDIQILPDLDGRAQVATYARFPSPRGLWHSALRFILMSDGTVFRLEVGGPAFLPKEELLDRELDALVNSWHPIDENATQP